MCEALLCGTWAAALVMWSTSTGAFKCGFPSVRVVSASSRVGGCVALRVRKCEIH